MEGKDEFVDIEMKEYLAWPELGSGSVCDLARSPSHWKYGKHEYGVEEQRQGNAIHATILEPELFDNDHLIIPKCNKATKAGKDVWTGFLKVLCDKGLVPRIILELKSLQQMHILVDNCLCMTRQEYDMCLLIRSRIDCHPKAKELLYSETSQTEVSARTNLNGVPVKIRPDVINTEKRFIVNIKTTQDARAFRRDAIKYNYDAQAAFYLTVSDLILESHDDPIPFCHYWLVVEKSPPFGILIYRAFLHDLSWGNNYFWKGLNNYRKLQETELNYYPGYTTQIIDVGTIGHGWREYDED